MASEQDVATVNIETYQGRCGTWLFSFNDSLTGAAADISSWDFAAQIRDLYDSTNILATMTFDKTGLADNQVLMSLSAADTLALPIADATAPGNFRSLKFTYDVVATVDGGCNYTVQRGAVIHFGSVTPTA